MEDNLRFETAASGLRAHPSERLWQALVAVALLALLAVVFQVFLRYDYVVRGAELWRIDRVTTQVCRVAGTGVDCADSARSTSTSTSPSLSTSTSAALLRLQRKPGR
jgi:hypothetical protein